MLIHLDHAADALRDEPLPALEGHLVLQPFGEEASAAEAAHKLYEDAAEKHTFPSKATRYRI